MITRVLLPLLLLSLYTQAQVTLDADGPGGVPTYNLITNALAPGYNPVEVPDCGHATFGNHITEVMDTDLGINVFQFFVHVNEDDDRCINFDRQRNEIKSYDQSPANLLGVVGETVKYRWKFKLPTGFQSSSSFTHLHQLKSVNDPYSSMPMITFTARKGTPDKLELRYAEFGSQSTIYSADLDPFKGTWVEAVETITYSNAGSYAIDIKRVSDGVSLFQYSSNNINVWRCGADFIRPKWGIYRSLNVPADLRDEEVRYANFSITETTTAGVTLTGLTLTPATTTMDIGDTQQVTPNISPANTTNQCVSYSSSVPSVATVSADGLVSALAAGTATITATTSDGSFTGTSVITINAAGTNACPILVDLKAMLQGAYDGVTSQMATDLATGTLVPTTEPYTGGSYTHVGGGGGEMTTSAIIAANDIVDWIVIELRDKANSANVVATRAALLRKDGQAVDVDGVSSVAFENVAADAYYIAVRHRNHLGVMTDAAVNLTASSVPTIVNVLNAGFEAGTSNWTNGSLGGTIQESSSPVYEGLKAGKLPADGSRIAYQLVTVAPNTNYDLSFWYTIKTTPIGGALTVHILDSHVTNTTDVAAATITSQTYNDQSSSNTYIEETISFNSGSSSQIAIYMTNLIADCRFDELTLVGTGTGCGGSSPTCSDGIQNGDETGVDCGGSCPTVCTNLCPTVDYPADNLGTNWKLNGYSGTLNVGTTNNGLTYVDNVPGFATHEDENWFYLGDDCWTYFKTYPGNPTSSGSGNPRTELREMVANGSTEIYWDGTTATEHSMKWRVKVDQLPQSGKLCFGQIHAGSGSAFDDVIRVQCQGSANQTSGSVTWRILGYVAEDLLGSGQSVGSFNLGDELYLELTMQNSIVTLYQLDNTTGARTNTIFTSGAVASTNNYFKAGCYLQSSQGQTANGATDFGLVGINEISVSH